MRKFFSILAAGAALGLAATPALADDYANARSDIDFFYVEIEGGYAGFDGPEDMAPGGLVLEPDGGGYVTATLGHISIENGIIGGFVDRAELWGHYQDQGDDAVATFTSERDYWEIGTRFQHYNDQYARNKTMWGVEPFIGFVDGTFRNVGMGTVTISHDATLFGAMVSFEAERYVTDRTVVSLRGAAGAYGGSSDVTSNGPAITDDDFSGFRGQFATGIDVRLNRTVKVGAVARLDYFSDMPVVNVPAGAMDTDHQLGFFIGARLRAVLAGTYE